MNITISRVAKTPRLGAMLGFSSALCWAIGFSPSQIRAQTAPVFETPTAASTIAAAPTSNAVLLNDTLDGDTQGIEFKAPDSVQIAADERASSRRALKWNYALGGTPPEISLPAGPSLSGARAVRFRIKTPAPAAVELWFETARSEDITKAPIRYTATIWTQGEQWQNVELDAARFVRTDGAVLQASDETLWREDWGRIARYGVRDVSNFWRKRLGQTSQNGARELWLDDVEVSTRPAANALVPIVVAPQPAPVAPIENDENVEVFGPPGFDQRAPRPEPIERRDNRVFQEVDPRQMPQPRPAEVLEDEDEDEGEEEDETPEVQGPPPITLLQDAWGAQEQWIPINGSTEAKAGQRAGLKWNYVRLANRDNVLVSTVNASAFNFPSESVLPPPRDPGVALRIESPRLARLVLEISTQKATRLNVSLHERSGAIYSQSVLLDPRRSRQRVTLYLPQFKREQTSRDANNQFDLNQVEAITLSDTGAQKGQAGPNEIGLYSVAWIY